jgi:ABC-2 type transport system permease protein
MNLIQQVKRLKVIIGFELRGMKIYWMQLFISLFIMPFAFVLILLAGRNEKSEIAFVLSGFMVASMVGSFLATLSLRVCNMMLPEILELYTTFGLRKYEMIIGLSTAYCLLILPQLVVAAALIIFLLPNIQVLSFLLVIFITILSILFVSVLLGLLVKNYFQAMGVFPLLSWVIILLSPAYYNPIDIHPLVQSALLINPLTHYLNLMRTCLGYPSSPLPMGSVIFILGLSMFALYGIKRHLREMYMLEKLY